MKTDRWQHVNELFLRALEVQPERRADFLDQECATDSVLRNEVVALLSADERHYDFMERPAVEVAAALIADEPTQLNPGDIISHYEIVRLIGKGGMGEVYLAADAHLQRNVALKLLPADFTRNHDRVKRFQHEAQAASGLNHPNILTIHEVGISRGQQFIATEFVDGETLRQRGERQRFSLTESIEVAIQIARAITAAHEAGIIHRDIKPENVMIRADGYVKVLDFGLAKLTDGRALTASSLATVDTEPGLILGTAKYMSPEQARGLTTDERTDIWSLGVILYEMVSGRLPFEGRTNADVLAAVLKSEPPPITQYCGGAPQELQSILTRSLSKEPQNRHSSAKEFEEELASLRRSIEFQTDDQSGGRVEVNITSRLIATDTNESAIVVDLKPSRRRTPVLRTAVILVVLFVTGALIWTIVSRYRSHSRNPAGGQLAFTKLTDNGQILDAIISPDGTLLATVRVNAGQQSLWLSRIDSSKEVPLVEPAPYEYWGIAFRNDATGVYYNIKKENTTIGELHYVPAYGGASRLVASNVDSPPTVSPNNTQVAFVRRYPSSGKDTIIIVNVETGAERELAARSHPLQFSFGGPSWSADGRTIAVGGGDSSTGSYSVYALDIASGAERQISPATWQSIGPVVLMPGGNHVAVSAQSEVFGTHQLWMVSADTGKAQKFTNDVADYPSHGGLSFTSDAKTLVAVQPDRRASLWIADLARGDYVRVGSGKNEGFYGVTWAPENRLIYTSSTNGVPNLWMMTTDGGNQVQLTNSGAVAPSRCLSGQYVLYVSTEAGKRNIFRVDLESGKQQELTNSGSEFWPSCSPDSNWMSYSSLHNPKSTIVTVPLNGGPAVKVTEGLAMHPIISPDGLMIACIYRKDQTVPWKVTVLPAAGGEPIRSFEMPNAYSQEYRWSIDGRDLYYLVTKEGVANIWKQPVAGGTPSQVTYFKEDTIYSYELSHDGKHMVLSRGASYRDMVAIRGFEE